MADLERNKLDESKNIFVSKLKDFDVWQKLKPVQLNPKFRYIGCVMNEKKQNNFKGYETLDDVKNDMRHYNNYLQWINENERFLYFDIDNVLLNECEFISGRFSVSHQIIQVWSYQVHPYHQQQVFYEL